MECGRCGQVCQAGPRLFDTLTPWPACASSLGMSVVNDLWVHVCHCRQGKLCFWTAKPAGQRLPICYGTSPGRLSGELTPGHPAAGQEMPRHKPTASGSCAGHWVTEGARLALFFWEPERQSSGGKRNRSEITLSGIQILSLSLTSLMAFGQMTAGCLSIKFDNNRPTLGSYWEAEKGMGCKKIRWEGKVKVIRVLVLFHPLNINASPKVWRSEGSLHEDKERQLEREKELESFVV